MEPQMSDKSNASPGAISKLGDPPKPPGFSLHNYKNLDGLSSSDIANILMHRFALLKFCYPQLDHEKLNFSSLLQSKTPIAVKEFNRLAITKEEVEQIIREPLNTRKASALRLTQKTTDRDGGPVRPLLLSDINQAIEMYALHEDWLDKNVRTAYDELAWGTQPYQLTECDRQHSEEIEAWRQSLKDRAIAVIDLSASKTYILQQFTAWLELTLEQHSELLGSVSVQVEKFKKQPTSIKGLLVNNSLLPLIDLAFILGPFYGYSYSIAYLARHLGLEPSRFRNSGFLGHIDTVLDFDVISELTGHMA
jgi:hypothetical protein